MGHNVNVLERGMKYMTETKKFPVGRMLHHSNTPEEIIFNVEIGTAEDGEFWYGDLTPSEMKELIRELVPIFKKKVIRYGSKVFLKTGEDGDGAVISEKIFCQQL